MAAGKVVLIVAGSIIVGIYVLGSVAPAPKSRPELIASPIVNCPRQEVAVALARALSTVASDRREVTRWSEQNGCGLMPSGTYITAVEEESGHSKVTKVTVNGVTTYMLGLPRPTASEKLDAAVSDLKRAVNGLQR